MGAVHTGGLVRIDVADGRAISRSASGAVSPWAGALLMRPGNIAASSDARADRGRRRPARPKGSGNKMMFIGQAVRRAGREFRRYKAASTRTLVLFTPAYSEAMLKAAAKSGRCLWGGSCSRNERRCADSISEPALARTGSSHADRAPVLVRVMPACLNASLSVISSATMREMSLDVLNCQKEFPSRRSPARHGSAAMPAGPVWAKSPGLPDRGKVSSSLRKPMKAWRNCWPTNCE